MSTSPLRMSLDPSRRRMSIALIVLVVMALAALVAARLSSPLLLFAERQYHGQTETPYGVLLVCLAALSGLVPAFDGSTLGKRALIALGVGVAASLIGSPLLPLGGYDFYARDGLYTFSFFAGIAFFVATTLTTPRRGASVVWWGSAGAVAVTLAMLSVMYWNARADVVVPGPAAGLLSGPVNCHVVSNTRSPAIPDDLAPEIRVAEAGVIDLGPGPGGGQTARLSGANRSNTVELSIDGRVAWRLRTPLGYGLLQSEAGLPAESALLWAKWTDAGGVIFALTRMDWRNPALWGTGPEYQIVTVYRVGP